MCRVPDSAVQDSLKIQAEDGTSDSHDGSSQHLPHVVAGQDGNADTGEAPQLCQVLVVIERVRVRWPRTGGSEQRARLWPARDWTEQEINLAKKFVCKVHPSG